MKRILLTISLSYLFSFNSFSQKPTYKDLIGMWKTEDSDVVHTVKFIDNFNAIGYVFFKKPSIKDSLIITYNLDTSSALTLIHFQGVGGQNMKFDIWQAIKIKPDTLQMQGSSEVKPTAWKKETVTNTQIFTRVKG